MKYKYRSIGKPFGFRVDAIHKLMFSHTKDTEFDDQKLALACEEYVATNVLERIGDDPMEGIKKEIPATVVIGPDGKSEKSPAPNTDVRSATDKTPTKAPAKAK